jgi:metal-sulfur cluster biosynthetic enzyme
MSESSPPSVESLREALRAVIDPEAGMNIVDLGLVYRIACEGDVVRVVMTMTSPACPMGEMIRDDVEATLRRSLPAGMRAEVELTWSPPWDPSMMSDKARRHFGW